VISNGTGTPSDRLKNPCDYNPCSTISLNGPDLFSCGQSSDILCLVDAPNSSPPPKKGANADTKKACMLGFLDQVGNQAQNYGIAFGIGGGAVTFLAPEAGVGEAAATYGVALYGAGSALKDSVSITNAVMNGRNDVGYLLGKANEVALKKVPNGALHDAASKLLDEIEGKLGFNKGGSNLCQ
jgi:hypothetical protein